MSDTIIDIKNSLEEIAKVKLEVDALRKALNDKKDALKNIEKNIAEARDNFLYLSEYSFDEEKFVNLYESVFKNDGDYLTYVMNYLERNMHDDEHGYSSNMHRSYDFLYEKGCRTSKDLFIETIKDDKIFHERERLRAIRDEAITKINGINKSIDERFEASKKEELNED